MSVTYKIYSKIGCNQIVGKGGMWVRKIVLTNVTYL